jgi:hypothetical protein
MIETIKEWLSQGRKEKIIGLLILFFAVYTVVWGLVEPILSADFIECIIKDPVKNWWKWQFSLSIFFTGIIFYILWPSKTLLVFGSEVQDKKLNEEYKTEGNPAISTINDGYYGNVYNITGDYIHDAIDWELSPHSYEASSISYIYQPRNNFILYLRVNLVSANGRVEQLKWIALRTDITIVPQSTSQEEIAYPVKGKSMGNGWLITHVNIHRAVKETFGRENWKYKSIRLIRIRGNANIHKIIIN